MSLQRREMLQLFGAGAAVASLEACSLGPSDEKIVPYVRQSPEVTPGRTRAYATSLQLDGYARGVLCTTQVGRPTKIEGNPDHPASLGGTSPFEQAMLLDLYSNARIKEATWSVVDAALSRGPAVLVIEPTTSPSVARLIEILRHRRRDIRVVIAGAPSFADTRALFAQPLEPVYDFTALTRLVTFGGDPTTDGPLAVRYARQLGEARRAGCRIYAIETAPSGIGVLADHRRALPPSQVVRTLIALASALGLVDTTPSLADDEAQLVRAMADDIAAARGAALVMTSPTASTEARIIAHAINAELSPERVRWIPTPLIAAANEGSLDGADTILAVGGNPAWHVDGFEAAMQRAKVSAYVGLFANATAHAAQHVAPLTHDLETWLDLRAGDGTLSIAQPLVKPLFPARSLLDVLGGLANAGTARDVVRASFAADQLGAVLELGCAPRTAFAGAAARIDSDQVKLSAKVATHASEGDALEIHLTNDARVGDGRFIHNPWMLELPQLVTTLTWDNAAQVSPATAARLKLATDDIVRVSGSSGAVDIPIVVTHGHADGAVSIAINWGETSAATGAVLGVDVRPLMQSHVVQLAAIGSRRLAIAQRHIEPMRDSATKVLPRNVALSREPLGPSLHPRVPGAAEQWGMVVDLDSCTGCGTCTIACQAENNIAVVGRNLVSQNRIMHWMRIDVYAKDDTIVLQPMLCQHCEAAPCEYVCPVNATTHSPDGINEMTYNRCVGTRFCSNNCPYKVRRFNWFDFTQDTPPVTQLVYNPDVTVRARGVMEKCTFCVQRIRRAGIDARIAGKPLRDGDVVTACAQACPNGAIVFGNIADPSSRIAKLTSRTYGALEDLGTRPRVRYLPRRYNKNPAVPS